MKMFRKKKTNTLPTSPVEYPAGVCVRTNAGTYLINKDGKRYKIATNAILNSWNFPLIVTTSEAALTNYPLAVTKLPFRDGTLLNNIADGRIYLVSGGKLRHVVSPTALDRLGNPTAVIVSDAEIKLMKQGDVIY